MKFIYVHEDYEDVASGTNTLAGDVVKMGPEDAVSLVPVLQSEGYNFWPTLGQHEDGCPPYFSSEDVAMWVEDNPGFGDE